MGDRPWRGASRLGQLLVRRRLADDRSRFLERLVAKHHLL